MKRMIMLAALAAFVIGFATTASAIVDVKASGSWRAIGAWTSNLDLLELEGDTQGDAGTEIQGEDKFKVWMRARTNFQFIANENLRGVWAVELGTGDWGNPATGVGGVGNDQGFALGSDEVGMIENKWLYLDFTIPNTEVNILAGMLPLALPGGYAGNPVLDDDVTALVVSTPLFDGIGLLGGWARAFDLADAGDADDSTDTSLDVLFAAVPMDFDWLTLAPYFAYAYAGDRFAYELTTGYTNYGGIPAGLVSQNATVVDADGARDEEFDVWWLGTNFGLNFDPFNIQGHVVYGDLDGWDNMERSGWEFDIALTFTGLDFVTPTLWFAYTSGEDGNGSDNDDADEQGTNRGESERLPVLSNGLGIGNMWRGGGVLGDGGVDRVTTADSFLGFYAIGLDLDGISFVDGLTHSLHFAHIWGNNDEKIGSEWNEENSGLFGNNANPYYRGTAYGATLLDDETVTEYVFTTTYQMYDQLQLILDIGYLDFDADDDDDATGDNDADDVNWDELDGDWAPADAEKFLLGVSYDF